MKRRNFLQQSSALAGGLFINSGLANAFNPTGEKLNIAIIGCGDRGNGLMLIAQQLPDLFEVKGLCDVLDFRLKKAVELAKSPQAKVTKDYRAILDDKSIDAVMIATPLNLHFKIAKDALLAGKHVYIEKTMTYDIPETFELVQLVKSRPKQTLQVGHQYRYTPLYFKVKDMITSNYLGKVTQIDCRWDRNWNWKRSIPSPHMERQVNWRMYRAYSGGLPAELLSHQMDFINWAFDTHPDEVLGTGGIDYYKDGRETFDNVQVLMRYKQAGMIGNFGATCGNAHDGYLFKIKGTKGSVSLLMDKGIYYPEEETKRQYDTVDGVTGATKLTWDKDGGLPIEAEHAHDGTWYALKDFYSCVTKNATPTSNVFTGARTSFCVHMANNSMYNNSIQYWKDEYNLLS
jgi:predicted dehydrogenase